MCYLGNMGNQAESQAYEKLTAKLTFRLSDTERAGIETAARAARCSPGEYLRRLHKSGATAPVAAPGVAAPVAAASLAVRHVNTLGPDPLWTGQEALKR